MAKLHLLGILTEEHAQRRGLMFRDRIPPYTGMLFVYDRPDILGFWMKNTSISLDLIFIDEDLRVNEITILEPFDLRSVRSTYPSVMALEVNRGDAQRLGIKVGDRVTVDTFWPYIEFSSSESSDEPALVSSSDTEVTPRTRETTYRG